MIEGNAKNITNRASLDSISYAFNKSNLRRFLEIIQERLNAASEYDISRFEKGTQSDEDFEANRKLIRDGFVVRPTVKGKNGQELYGTIHDVFDSPNFPEEVESVYLGSEIWLKVNFNYLPYNTVEIFLDFTRPEIFNFSFLPSQKTPNETSVKVRGSDATWVNGIFHEVDAYLKEHRASAPWLHKHSVYDILVWIFGLPVAFWICFKVSPLLANAEQVSQFLIAAFYVYIFLFSLVGIRALFHYTRWVFPLAEYTHGRSKLIRHRLVLGTLVLSLVCSVIYDVFKLGFLS